MLHPRSLVSAKALLGDRTWAVRSLTAESPAMFDHAASLKGRADPFAYAQLADVCEDQGRTREAAAFRDTASLCEALQNKGAVAGGGYKDVRTIDLCDPHRVFLQHLITYVGLEELKFDPCVVRVAPWPFKASKPYYKVTMRHGFLVCDSGRQYVSSLCQPSLTLNEYDWCQIFVSDQMNTDRERVIAEMIRVHPLALVARELALPPEKTS